jgi:hypothetical protein
MRLSNSIKHKDVLSILVSACVSQKYIFSDHNKEEILFYVQIPSFLKENYQHIQPKYSSQHFMQIENQFTELLI